MQTLLRLGGLILNHGITHDEEGWKPMMTPTTLSSAELEALAAALDDEYKSYETYRQVIQQFGDVRPFINIVEAEVRHIASLVALFKQYGSIPLDNLWAGKAPAFMSVGAACAAGIQGEIENVALYDRLLQSTERLDILNVFHALRAASQDPHLPAFQRCAQRVTHQQVPLHR